MGCNPTVEAAGQHRGILTPDERGLTLPDFPRTLAASWRMWQRSIAESSNTATVKKNQNHGSRSRCQPHGKFQPPREGKVAAPFIDYMRPRISPSEILPHFLNSTGYEFNPLVKNCRPHLRQCFSPSTGGGDFRAK